MKVVEGLKHDKRGRRRKYIFEVWSDGQVREVDVAAEFGIKPDTFKSLLHRYARKNNLTSKYCTVEGTTIQFVLLKKGGKQP